MQTTPFFGSSGSISESYLIIILIVLLLQLRTRHVKIRGLILWPALMLLLTLPVIAPELISGPLDLTILITGFILGAGLGALRSSLTAVMVDENDGSMIIKGSVLSVLVWAAIIAVKLIGENLAGMTGVIDFNLLTSLMLMLSLGAMITRRWLLYARYLRMRKESSTLSAVNGAAQSFCIRCGTKLSAAACFCHKCGQPVPRPYFHNPSGENKMKH